MHVYQNNRKNDSTFHSQKNWTGKRIRFHQKEERGSSLKSWEENMFFKHLHSIARSWFKEEQEYDVRLCLFQSKLLSPSHASNLCGVCLERELESTSMGISHWVPEGKFFLLGLFLLCFLHQLIDSSRESGLNSILKLIMQIHTVSSSRH